MGLSKALTTALLFSISPPSYGGAKTYSNRLRKDRFEVDYNRFLRFISPINWGDTLTYEDQKVPCNYIYPAKQTKTPHCITPILIICRILSDFLHKLDVNVQARFFLVLLHRQTVSSLL